MKLLIQRVLTGSVVVGGKIISEIGPGLVVLIGIHEMDDYEICRKLAQKLPHIRLWDKQNKKWAASTIDNDYEILVVSQFTLYATMKGRKPDFHLAKCADKASLLYEQFINEVAKVYKPEKIKSGAFQEYMIVNIQNDGPVTLELEEISTTENPLKEPLQKQFEEV